MSDVHLIHKDAAWKIDAIENVCLNQLFRFLNTLSMKVMQKKIHLTSNRIMP
ncbi:hypothetical protein EI42_04926 [Thermosporothrix hazakensis]|jgi:hypothetical protein|uniref:Uncharacterized protein n=1 Tax=Thermosporothrix hazakensis TaxID=644383 RepID=A0A326UCZ4_THEHA|nr:hypothetical protein EI42_04926 [Thermosporothrix hazakensis]